MGWKQLPHGRFTQAWQELFTTQAPSLTCNHFLSKIIYQGWMILLTIWKLWNTHLYPPNDHLMDQTQLYALVEHIFHMVSNDPMLWALITYTMIDQIMQRSIHDIRKWIKISTAHLNAHQEGAKNRALLNTHDICSYFLLQDHPPSPQTPNKNLLWPP